MDMHLEHQQDKSTIYVDKNQLLGLEAAELQNNILDSIEKGSKDITIDMSKVDYVTSWGIGMLVHSFTTCTNRNINFSLTGVSDRVNSILSKVKLQTIFNIR
ncbi:MAG: STAS domain-containing protein [Ignavibacteriaceae bacterium]